MPNEVHALISVFPPHQGDQPTLPPLLPPLLSLGASAPLDTTKHRETRSQKSHCKAQSELLRAVITLKLFAKCGDALAQMAQGGAPELQGCGGPEGHSQQVQWEGLDLRI